MNNYSEKPAAWQDTTVLPVQLTTAMTPHPVNRVGNQFPPPSETSNIFKPPRDHDLSILPTRLLTAGWCFRHRTSQLLEC
jgi:hypothetical protein